MLLSIQALLSAPNPDDPLANDVAEQWKKNESAAIETGERLVVAPLPPETSGVLPPKPSVALKGREQGPYQILQG